jgi:hypothetical protein
MGLRDKRGASEHDEKPINVPPLRSQTPAYTDPAHEFRLDEGQISTALEVNRTPVRAALSLLETGKFIRGIPRRGNCIPMPTSPFIAAIIVAAARRGR